MPDHKLQCPVSVLCHAVLAKKKINSCSFHFSLSMWIMLWSLSFHSQNLNFNSLHCLPYFPLKVNLLTPKSDEHLISPYIITPESNIKVMRIKEMIAYLLNKLSLSATGRKERGSDNWVLSYFFGWCFFFFSSPLSLRMYWYWKKTLILLFLTLKLPWVIKTEFLLTISIQYQLDKQWE